MEYYGDFTVVPDDDLQVESMEGFLGYHADTYVTGTEGTQVGKDVTGAYDVIKAPKSEIHFIFTILELLRMVER
ncbi:hypothetical protein [Streptococcus pneumoniae]|uniref:hypothetical protein n=1 Tax=Streptococcus pneumoniae TaxID=1313 RepID=UPI0015F17C78|nr:hypothetical protein [Streptococcus pneumoniae]